MMFWFCIVAAYAGAWTRDKDSYYARVGADYFVPRIYVNPLNGQPVDTDRRYFGQQYGVYGELGLSSVWPVQLYGSAPLSIGSLTFETASGTAVATTIQGGDMKLGVQTALTRKAPLAIAIDLKVPLYRNDEVGAGYGAYAGQFPKPGDGQLDTTFWLHFGGGVPRTRLWGEAAVGYRHRSERFVGETTDRTYVDGLPLLATVGESVGPVLVMLKADAIFAFESDVTTRSNVSAGPVVMWTIKGGFAVEARYSRDLWAKHASYGDGFGVGVSWRDP